MPRQVTAATLQVIEDMISHFNFVKLQAVRAICGARPPQDATALHELARILLKACVTFGPSEYHCEESCGLRAERIYGTLRLSIALGTIERVIETEDKSGLYIPLTSNRYKAVDHEHIRSLDPDLNVFGERTAVASKLSDAVPQHVVQNSPSQVPDV